MSRSVRCMRITACGVLIAGLLSVGARPQERFSPLALDQLTPEQQTMATMLATPPRNNKLNTGPFNAYARSPGLGSCCSMSAILSDLTARCRRA